MAQSYNSIAKIKDKELGREIRGRIWCLACSGSIRIFARYHLCSLVWGNTLHTVFLLFCFVLKVGEIGGYTVDGEEYLLENGRTTSDELHPVVWRGCPLTYKYHIINVVSLPV